MKRRHHGARRAVASAPRCRQAAARAALAPGRRMLVAMFTALTLVVCAPIRQARAQTAASAAVASPATSPAGVAIQSLAAAGKLPEPHWSDFSDYRSAVVEFYSAGGWTPAWTTDGAPTAAALGMIDLFRQARLKGLDPNDYDGGLWPARLARLRSEGARAAPADIAQFDVAMTVCAMRYLSDLHLGRVNPNDVKFFLNAGSKKLDLAQTLRADFIGAADPAAIVTQVEPPYAEYQRAEVALAHYLELARGGDGPVLPPPAASVHPGGSYSALAQLAARLRLVGDLPADAPAPAVSGRYEGAIVEAVRRFQRRHGLATDGVLGKATIAALNVPMRVRVEELGYTLERYRWMPLDFPEPPIVVNLPEFILRTMRRQPAPFLEMRVVVGKAYRHQTPVFTGMMRYVIFRPWWNVPYSITRAELIPKIVKNRNYLAANNFAVFTSGGTMVSDGAVTDGVLAGLRSGSLNIRQQPGPKNALGLVKFIFPNSYNVYLHSTPAPELFEKSRRDFSHGCIRVQNPVGLAAWVLRGMPAWTTDRIVQTMNGGQTLQVNLPRPIPVLIIYLTAEVEPDGEVRFFDDIYGHDAELRQALAARRRLAAAPAP